MRFPRQWEIGENCLARVYSLDIYSRLVTRDYHYNGVPGRGA